MSLILFFVFHDDAPLLVERQIAGFLRG
jgi:hypothetical protein